MTTGPDHRSPQDEPGVASVEYGQVLLDGPDAVAVAITPEAAAETGRRLIAAADRAGKEGAGEGGADDTA